MIFMPMSKAARAQFSDAICAAKGVLLRDPLKSILPAVAQHNTFPCRSVIVTIVLLKDA